MLSLKLGYHNKYVCDICIFLILFPRVNLYFIHAHIFDNKLDIDHKRTTKIASNSVHTFGSHRQAPRLSGAQVRDATGHCDLD